MEARIPEGEPLYMATAELLDWSQGDTDEIYAFKVVRAVRYDALADKLAERDAEIHRLQRALSFWHPGVPELASEAIRDRAADDAFLLCGFHGPHEVDAVARGWIKLIVAAQTETSAQRPGGT